MYSFFTNQIYYICSCRDMSWKSAESSQIAVISGVSFLLHIYSIFHTSLVNVTHKSDMIKNNIQNKLEEKIL